LTVVENSSICKFSRIYLIKFESKNKNLTEITLTLDVGLSYGAIFSIIDGTNCSPKAVLACNNFFVSKPRFLFENI
jgi:hypothetical protein